MTDLLIVQEEGKRLDKILADTYPRYSRTYFQFLIESGAVLCNGKILKKREKPHVGDEIEICFLLTPEISVAPENIPLDILYEDEHLLAINKPAGMVVHPAPGHSSNTFVNALLHHCRNLPEGKDPSRPGIVHRLDKDTSGILLAAKTQEAHHKLISLFAQRKMSKHYLAVCVGNPGSITISAPIKRHPTRRQEMAICLEKGKEAITRCTPLAYDQILSLIEVELLTGRTHQIRVHLKSCNTPVLGDALYGAPSSNKKFNAQRQLLHAHRLQFMHPITQEKLQLTAPIPDDMKVFVNNLLNK